MKNQVEKLISCIKCNRSFGEMSSFATHGCFRRNSKLKIKNKCRYCNSKTSKVYCNQICRRKYEKELKLFKIKNGTADPRKIKEYLIKKYGAVCMNKDCAWDFKKKMVSVELEHIDGNHTNNNLSNTILLCPNCHSLTPTYKNKNKGRGRYYRRLRYKQALSY